MLSTVFLLTLAYCIAFGSGYFVGHDAATERKRR
jgi:hypothetical protein